MVKKDEFNALTSDLAWKMELEKHDRKLEEKKKDEFERNTSKLKQKRQEWESRQKVEKMELERRDREVKEREKMKWKMDQLKNPF